MRRAPRGALFDFDPTIWLLKQAAASPLLSQVGEEPRPVKRLERQRAEYPAQRPPYDVAGGGPREAQRHKADGCASDEPEHPLHDELPQVAQRCRQRSYDYLVRLAEQHQREIGPDTDHQV